MKYEYKLMMPSVTNIANICSKLHWKIHDHRAVERWIHRGCELHPSGGPLLSKICRRDSKSFAYYSSDCNNTVFSVLWVLWTTHLFQTKGKFAVHHLRHQAKTWFACICGRQQLEYLKNIKCFWHYEQKNGLQTLNIAIAYKFCFVSQMMHCKFLFETNEMFTQKGQDFILSIRNWLGLRNVSIRQVVGEQRLVYFDEKLLRFCLWKNRYARMHCVKTT